MNQDYGPAGALDHKVQPRFVNGHEFRVSMRILVSNARCDVAPLESSGNVHRKNLSPQANMNADFLRENNYHQVCIRFGASRTGANSLRYNITSYSQV